MYITLNRRIMHFGQVIEKALSLLSLMEKTLIGRQLTSLWGNVIYGAYQHGQVSAPMFYMAIGQSMALDAVLNIYGSITLILIWSTIMLGLMNNGRKFL